MYALLLPNYFMLVTQIMPLECDPRGSCLTVKLSHTHSRFHQSLQQHKVQILKQCLMQNKASAHPPTLEHQVPLSEHAVRCWKHRSRWHMQIYAQSICMQQNGLHHVCIKQLMSTVTFDGIHDILALFISSSCRSASSKASSLILLTLCPACKHACILCISCMDELACYVHSTGL